MCKKNRKERMIIPSSKQKHFKKYIYIALLASFVFNAAISQAQLVVNNNIPAVQLANTLIGGGVTISNISVTGLSAMYGTFSNGNTTNLGLASGILLTTGKADSVANKASFFMSKDMGQPGDADLNAINTTPTFDACILEFDFVPQSDTVRFRYVFGSEEYPKYVCAQYNDIFAFFISGPNPSGGNYTKHNIALIPGTTLPVSVNSVNNGNIGSGAGSGDCTGTDQSLAYSAYYVDNAALNGQTIVFGGFTKVLTALCKVVPCQTYHIKLAVADGYNGLYDSGVFIEAKSFSTPSSVNLSTITSTNGQVTADSTIAEGCGKATYIFTRSGNNSQPYTVNYTIGGTATNGVDYQNNSGQAIANSVVFPAGVDTEYVTINAIQDGIPEPTETVIIKIPQTNACVDTVKSTIYIKNVDPLKLSVSGDSTICSQLNESATIKAHISGGFGPYAYVWTPSTGTTTTDSSITVSPSQTTTYTVSITDSCSGTKLSSAFTVEVLCPIEIPNVITPNGDSYNDVFFIKNLDEYPKSELIIFNRWGKIIYQNSDYQNNWDGTKHSDGTYFYILTLNNGKRYHGILTLIKK
jgi:gliding motility-associated-like protein